MKVLICLVVAAFVASIECKTPQGLSAPKKCEDVLQQHLCDDLRRIAKTFKLQLSRVDDLVLDAALKGLVNAPVVFSHVVLFLKYDVMSKTCEDLLAPRMCVKLREVAAFLKLKAEVVDRFVRDAIAKGYTKGEEVYTVVLDFYKAEVRGKTCEDFLAPDVCTQLRKVAANLKVKAEKVEEAVVSAIVQGYQNRHEIYQDVLDFFRDEVLSKTCEDVLANDLCASLRKIASTLKIEAAKVDKFVKEALIKGMSTTRDVYQAVRDFYKAEIQTKKCEDFLSTTQCDGIRKVAASFKVKADKVDDFVKDALTKGYTQVKEIVDDAVAHLKDAITCEDWLPSWTCSAARSLARHLGVKVREVNEAVKKAVADGVRGFKSMYKSVKEYLNQQTLV